MAGKILLFHVNILKQNQIAMLAREMGLELAAVAPEDYGRVIGVLAGTIKQNGPVKKTAGKMLTGNASAERTSGNHDFSDEMMVFCGISSEQLDAFLLKYRQAGISPIALKAVLTPFNAMWTPGMLCAELKKERTALGEK